MKLNAKQSVLASYKFLLTVLLVGVSNSGDFSFATFFPPVTSPIRNGILRRSDSVTQCISQQACTYP